MLIFIVNYTARADLQIHPVSPEAVRAYLDGTLADDMDLIDLDHQLDDLSLSTLSSTEVEIWQDLCLDLLLYPGDLPYADRRVDPDEPSRSVAPLPLIEGDTFYYCAPDEEIFRTSAISALFRISVPSDDPGERFVMPLLYLCHALVGVRDWTMSNSI